MDTLNYLAKQKRKLTLIFTLIMFFTLTFLEGFFLVFKYIDTNNREFQRLDSQTKLLTKQSQNNNLQSIKNIFKNFPRRFSETSRRNRTPNMIIHENKTSLVLFSSIDDDVFQQDLISKVKSTTKNKGEVTGNNGEEYLFVYSNINDNSSILSFTESTFTMTDLAKDFFGYMIFVVLFSFLVYIFGYRFVSYTLSPVDENIKDMEQFIYNAGHELRTPLAVVKSSLQLAKIKKDATVDINTSISEINKMSSLIQSLMSLSTIKEVSNTSKVNINKIVNEDIKQRDEEIKNKEIKITLKENHKLDLNTNEEYFNILFSNILSNAIKYNKQGGQIEVTIDKGSLQVTDTGIGIKKENIEKVFDRFFQDADSRNQEGYGIGLSLVKKIADLHSWKIDIESEKGVGTKVKVIF